MTLARRIESDGYGVLRQALSAQEVEAWRGAVETFAGAVARNLLANRAVWNLAQADSLRAIYEPLLGPGAAPVRGLLFDKRPDRNWGVGWHQDTVIAVAERTEHTPLGYTAWSVKEGAPHVRPPVDVLERMLTLRLALDDADAENGALQVMPETHRSGRLEPNAVQRLIASGTATTCVTAVGDVVAMFPLLLHASTKAAADRRRRVVHLEYAARPLPPPLSWPRWRHRQDPRGDDESPL